MVFRKAIRNRIWGNADRMRKSYRSVFKVQMGRTMSSLEENEGPFLVDDFMVQKKRKTTVI